MPPRSTDLDQPELDSEPLSSAHDVAPPYRQERLATPECDLGTNEIVRERTRLAVVGQVGHGGSILKD
jgi:hypothetical protein